MTTEISSTTAAANVLAFTGKETAPDGFIVHAYHYKTKKGETTKEASKAAIVPRIVVTACEPAMLLSAMQDAIDSLQFDLVRSLIDDKKQTMIAHSDCDAAALKRFALEQAASKRLNKEQISDWFDAFVSDGLTTAFATKLGYSGDGVTTEQLAKLAAATNVYRDQFLKLAAPLPAIDQQTAEKLQKALEVAADGGIKAAIAEKLATLVKPVSLEMLGL